MKRVVSYSLYGDIEKYTIGAIKNAEALSSFYPGWEGWFYVGKTVPKEITDRLSALGMKVIPINKDEDSAAMMWRFLAFADKNVEYAIIRDTDSRLSKRESIAVNEWLNSGKSFHIMRDHPCHVEPIPGGMWGAKAEKLRNMDRLIADWNGEKVYSTDQLFLKKQIYPQIQQDSLVHADFNAFEPHAVSFPTKRDSLRFVGEIFDENNTPDKSSSKILQEATESQAKKLFHHFVRKFVKEKNQKITRTGEIKVVHVSASLFPVSAASRLISAQRLAGIDAFALAGHYEKLNFPCYKNILGIGQKSKLNTIRLYRKIANKYLNLKRLILKKNLNRNEPDHPWNDGMTGESIHNTINKINPDIVHLHWIASGFPAIKYLPKINKPIVWTFHDVWPLTAGHHLDMNCNECYKDGRNCSQFDKNNSKYPSSRYLWQRKMKFYKKIKDLTVVTPSHWLADKVKQSPLFEGRKVKVIPNCIDTKLFKPLEKSACRKVLNLPLDKKILLFSASGGVNIWYKGYDLLIDSLRIIKEKTKKEEIHLIILGSSENETNKPPFGSTFFGHVDSELLLSIIYNAADVFVGPSKQDNFPNTFVESLSCGVPAVGFNVGGIPEIVQHKERGYIAKKFDTNDLADGILWVLEDSARYALLSANSRRFAEENLSFSVIAEKHKQLYEQIISNRKTTQQNI